MVRPGQFPAIGAFDMGLRHKRMVRAAHVALRRGGFSLWNRHGGNPFLNKITRFCRKEPKTAPTENVRGGGKPKPRPEARKTTVERANPGL